MFSANPNDNHIMLNIGLTIFVIVVSASLIAIIFFAISFISKQKKSVSKKQNSFRKRGKKNTDISIVNDFVINLANALAKMANDKVGALIVIENKDSLNQYIEVGNKIDSAFYSEFVYSIFYNHSSALHDGSIIVQNWRIKSLSSYLPISKKLLDVKYGARHRASFGITEITDAFAFVVSETKGTIMCMFNNNVYQLDRKPSILVDQILKILFSAHYKLVGQEIPTITN